MLSRVMSVIVVAASSACSLITDENRRERVVGQLDGYGPPGEEIVTVADTVAKGATFPVVFRTFGNACVEKGDDDLSVVGQTAVVIPYDFERRDGGCDDVGLTFEHVVQLRFGNVGSALIVVNGRGRHNMPVTLQRVVMVK